MTKTSLSVKIGLVIGYVVAFVSTIAVAWSLGLERSVLGFEKPSLVWMTGLFAGLFMVSTVEVKRLKDALAENYPKLSESKNLIAISIALSMAVSAFILK